MIHIVKGIKLLQTFQQQKYGKPIHTRLRTSLQNATTNTRRNHMGPFPLSKSPEKKVFVGSLGTTA